MGKKRWNKKKEEKRRGKGRERGVEEDGPYKKLITFYFPFFPLLPVPHSGVFLGGQGGGTDFCHNTPLKMHLSYVSR